MNIVNFYEILNKYKPQDLYLYSQEIETLKTILRKWANTHYIYVFESGSRAKGTAISISSDVDFLVSLHSNYNDNNGGLKNIYESLYQELKNNYSNVKKQNVSIRIEIPSRNNNLYCLQKLEVDITPARKQLDNTGDHSLWVSKLNTWKKTNIQKHIDDIQRSYRKNEIKLLKIWREIHNLDFPSIYLEYLIINNIFSYQDISSIYFSSPEILYKNFRYILSRLASNNKNPLFDRVIDPANSNNILSDLLTREEKEKIIEKAIGYAYKDDLGFCLSVLLIWNKFKPLKIY